MNLIVFRFSCVLFCVSYFHFCVFLSASVVSCFLFCISFFVFLLLKRRRHCSRCKLINYDRVALARLSGPRPAPVGVPHSQIIGKLPRGAGARASFAIIWLRGGRVLHIRLSCFVFRVSFFVFRISFFVFPFLHFLFCISYFLFCISFFIF